MRPVETIRELTQFERRIAGSDAERRAANRLAADLRQSGRDVVLEAFWQRPNTALAHSCHVAVALAGSLVAVHNPRVGGGLILVSLLSIIGDAFLGISPGRRLTRERSSQNVVSPPRERDAHKPLRLIITANYDAGRAALVHRDFLRRPPALIKRILRGYVPGWLGWLVVMLLWLLAIAVARLEGAGGASVGLLQLLPTIALVIALALLLDFASADITPGANDNASGVAVALALTRALDAAPPRRVAVELVLQGASDGSGEGLKRYLKRRRKALKASNTVVLGVAPCGAGQARWWLSDGQMIPLRYLARLRALCESLAATGPELDAGQTRGRGATPALPARAAQLPAITIGCLDALELAPRSHQSADTADNIDPAALDAVVEFGLLLTDAIDGFLKERDTRYRPGATQRKAA